MSAKSAISFFTGFKVLANVVADLKRLKCALIKEENSFI